MKALIRKIARYAITILLVIIAVVIIFRAWVFYTESPWTRDAKFAADVVAISPDVTGLITDVPVHDNQLVVTPHDSFHMVIRLNSQLLLG